MRYGNIVRTYGNANMTIAYISHPDCLLHNPGKEHPDQPERLYAIQDQLIRSGLEFVLVSHEAPLAAVEDLARAHDPAYVADLFARAPATGILQLDDDTFMTPHTLKAARRAAGAAVQGVDLVTSGGINTAFCAVRPPGHHAGRGRAMGFCYFNNVAVGAAYALEVKGLQRIAIVDFDVHHGNGTEEIFEHDSRVLFCSSYQSPFYPFTGQARNSEHSVNTPLPAGSGGAQFRQQIENSWLPALHRFAPQLLMISAGFDGHLDDDMAQLNLLDTDYAWVTGRIKEIADRYAQGRIVSTLEGGYNLDALGRSVAAHLDALLG
jgi:acetoin utilization deacetylase AcuC-like enzyme